MSPILGIWASQNYSRYSLPTSFESIATTTVGSGGAANVEFTSIPSTYKHLQIRMIGQATFSSATGDDFYLQFNSDTGANYSYHRLYGNGSSAGGVGVSGATSGNAGMTAITNTTDSVFGASIIDILDYADTNKYKTVRSLGGFDRNGSGVIELLSLNWRSTSAVTSIKLFYSGQNWKQYTTFALYGIKGE